MPVYFYRAFRRVLNMARNDVYAFFIIRQLLRRYEFGDVLDEKETFTFAPRVTEERPVQWVLDNWPIKNIRLHGQWIVENLFRVK